jgi:hypothetical protein
LRDPSGEPGRSKALTFALQKCETVSWNYSLLPFLPANLPR